MLTFEKGHSIRGVVYDQWLPSAIILDLKQSILLVLIESIQRVYVIRKLVSAPSVYWTQVPHSSPQDWWYIAQSQGIFHWHWEHALHAPVENHARCFLSSCDCFYPKHISFILKLCFHAPHTGNKPVPGRADRSPLVAIMMGRQSFCTLHGKYRPRAANMPSWRPFKVITL